ncbi:MAG: hypothetical protein J6S23_01255 [Clostridia bacterium]|nr:hypothetical protein [Clostridia bacterium]
MPLTRAELKAKFNEVLGMVTPENQASVTELMSTLNDEYDSILTENETLTNRNQELVGNNEKLRSVNAELFLKVGVSDKKAQQTDTTDEVPEAMTYDALFNDKGELM